MNFEVYNKNENNLKVAFFSKRTFGGIFAEKLNMEKISKYSNIEIHLFDSENKNLFEFKSVKDHDNIESDREVLDNYKLILKYIKENKIKVCIFFVSGFPWSEKFLNELKKYSYAACYFGDDPEACEKTSKYYVKNFNYSFCGGVYFNKKIKISEQYLKWGARKSKFIPLGASPVKYKEPFNSLDSRNIDLVYVGSCYFPKVFRMFKLKSYFGNRMKIYGRGWNESGSFVKTIVLKIIKFLYNVPIIEELPKNKLVELYQNTKIGFNTHMSYGPSNLRIYELPINGVMQICDCENGLKNLYEIGKEVIAYKNIKDAIKKIEYYLAHDGERIAIAKAGYERAKKYYKTEISFEKIIDEIRKDIDNNYKQIYLLTETKRNE